MLVRANKKTILISWLIGVGFGLFFSGIILSILLYTSNKTTPVAVDKPEQIGENISNIVLEDNGQETQIDTSVKEKNEAIERPEQKIEEADEQIEEGETQKAEVKTIELTIESAATAHDITRILIENKVISDYDEFIAHIVKHNAERSLAHGTMTFPLNSDIETVFKILRP